MDSNDELEKIQSEIENRKLELALQEEDKKKSIDKISVSDIKIKLDDSKSIGSQAEDVVGAMVTASAINDDKIKTALTDKKAEELVNRFVKIIIDNLDGIICRYDKTGDGVKPKIKIVFWVILGLLVVGAICLRNL